MLLILLLLVPIVMSRGTKYSVSGISAGGFFAVQHAVAYSNEVEGVAAFAAGPYFCSEGLVNVALTSCMKYPELISVTALELETRGFADYGQIDPVSNILNQSVYLFSGTVDTVVDQGVAEKLKDFYQAFSPRVLKSEFQIKAEHCIPTDSFGKECAYNGSPWINNCDYSGAGDALRTIYGSDEIVRSKQKSENLLKLKQSPPFGISMSEFYFVYLPDGCKDEKTRQQVCKVHVNYHGCHQGYTNMGEEYVKNNGFNDYAEGSNIIVIYPQVETSLLNPKGCFDWFGYTGPEFALKSSFQLSVVQRLLDDWLE